MEIISTTFSKSWELLLDSSTYILFGILIGGILKIFLSPDFVFRHLGKGRISSVFKAALLGVPIPLCSCGVLPAAASLKRQGANNGATTAFLISTPESGVDSIAISYALLDPFMAIIRPIAGAVTGIFAGITENLTGNSGYKTVEKPDQSCVVDGCCDGIDCEPVEHAKHHSFKEKISSAFRYAFGELWSDLAGWFFVGLLLAGAVTAIIPVELMHEYLGGGLSAMLIMLVIGIPIYICATASTPIAAALILQGVSPGAALVFLLAGPATNVTSLTVLFNVLGKKATGIYLFSIAAMSVTFGLVLDAIYGAFQISAQATIGEAAHIIPFGVKLAATVFLLIISAKPIYTKLRNIFTKHSHVPHVQISDEMPLKTHTHSHSKTDSTGSS